MVETNLEKFICATCDKSAKSRCSGCAQVYYCSVDHQKCDWKNHKQNCRPFKIEKNDKIGRHYVATRNIRAGEIILKELPLVIGASQITEPVCVGCLESVQQKKSLECGKCGWPICSEKCQKHINHKNECELTVARGSKVSIKSFIAPHPIYECLLPLRCCLLKENNKEKWEKLMQLQSHLDEWKHNDQYKEDLEKIGKFIPRFFKCDKWTEDEIMSIVGIIRTNGHEVPLTNPPCVAIYHQASLIEHSCSPNLVKSFSETGEVIFWAPNEIKTGEHLTITYTDALWGTANRRHHLKQTKLFDCDCERCQDVTENGSYMSALKCQKCENGLLLPKNLEDWEKEWSCNDCSNSVQYSYHEKLIEHVGVDLQAMQKENEDNCIKFIEHYSRFLSLNHFYIVDVKISLSELIGGGGLHGIQNISEDKLKLKAKICRELCDVIGKVAPNEARVLGLVKFELHSSYAEMGRRALITKNPTCKSLLEESLLNCQESIHLLRYEPKILPEGQVCQQAKLNEDSLKSLIAGLSDAGL